MQAARRQMFARYETALAELLAHQTGVAAGSVQPFVAAALSLLRAGLVGYAIATDQPPDARTEHHP